MTPTIRSIKDTDLDALRRLFFRLSPETIYRRFFTLYSRPPEEALRHLCFVDHHDRVAFVADVDGDLVGVARFDRVPGTTEAEVAVVVEDAWQRHGVARALLDRLDLEALRLGVTTFTATTQSDNRAVLALVQATAHDVVVQMDGTETQLRMAV